MYSGFVAVADIIYMLIIKPHRVYKHLLIQTTIKQYPPQRLTLELVIISLHRAILIPLVLFTCPQIRPLPLHYSVAARQVSPASASLWVFQVLMAQARPWMPVCLILVAEAMPHWIFKVRGALPIVENHLHRHGRVTQNCLLRHGVVHQKLLVHGLMLLFVTQSMAKAQLFSQQHTMFICGGVLANWKGEIL